ncbi:asparagine synthetase A [Pyrobaculum sp. 3827-6]|uniref:asparagine synthetase A n=1 Tax=Pyrobaculum sp. 3827-6 TaxID=2983604 RepID=UPI0021DA1CAE|nr:asparagine synthetase A [Pyrobaculum sp. 3827-6]MCU7786735.1 asparagine synthetase A [Pyrobaculum sp. 3827-6]
MDYLEPRFHPAVVEFEKFVADREGYRRALEEWLRYSWRWARVDKYRLVFKIQAAALRAIREFLDSQGFTEVLPPIIGPVTDPGIRGARQAAIDFYGREYKVMSSAILYKQYMAASLGKIYFVSPNVRLEPPDSIYTGRHLVEFVQVDVEILGADYHKAMEVAEGLVAYVVRAVGEEYGRELEKVFGRSLPELKPPFRRYSHGEVVKIVNSLGCRNPPDAELEWSCERLFSGLHRQPVFIYDYPKGSRGFYDREDPARPGVLRDFDMLYPEGFGEAVSGAEREYEPERVAARIREGGEDPARYQWYLEMLRELYPLQTAGFGIGVERLTRYLCGLRAVWEARPYPKLAGIAPTP